MHEEAHAGDRPVKVLIIDDEPLIARGLTHICQRKQVEAYGVYTGTDALEEISSSSYDLAFLDLFLPNVDGLEILKKVKEISPGTKVVVMSASCLDEQMRKTIEDHAYLFMPKPIDLLQVKTLLSQAIKMKMEPEKQVVPHPVVNQERRYQRVPRKDVIEFRIILPTGSEQEAFLLSGKSINICEGGVGLYSPSSFRFGTTLLFKGILEGKKGIVKWCEQSEEGFRIGIEFL